MSKIQDMRDHMLATRNWDLQAPSEEQAQGFEILRSTLKNGYLTNIGDRGKLIGLIQGYALIADSESLNPGNEDILLCCKLYKNGSVTRVFYASDQEAAREKILHRMAWGALARRTNIGVWQRQLPVEISPFRRSYHHPGPNGEITG